MAAAYLKALEMVNERETKAFIIRQLQILGQDECVDALASCLNDESLSGPAARALAAIGSEKSGQALVAALKSRSGSPKTQKDVIRAIADAQVKEADLESFAGCFRSEYAEGCTLCTEPCRKPRIAGCIGGCCCKCRVHDGKNRCERSLYSLDQASDCTGKLYGCSKGCKEIAERCR